MRGIEFSPFSGGMTGGRYLALIIVFFHLHSVSSPEGIIAPAWLWIFGGRPISRWTAQRAFRSHSPARRMHFPKQVRSGFRLRSILRVSHREPVLPWREFQRDRKFPAHAKVNATTKAP